jgi:hypothetical protein
VTDRLDDLAQPEPHGADVVERACAMYALRRECESHGHAIGTVSHALGIRASEVKQIVQPVRSAMDESDPRKERRT